MSVSQCQLPIEPVEEAEDRLHLAEIGLCGEGRLWMRTPSFVRYGFDRSGNTENHHNLANIKRPASSVNQ